MPDVPVLVVEGDSSNAKLLVVLLRAEGADARSASSAESALSLLPYVRPRVVITEAVLPEMGGLDLARELRKLDPTMTIVIVTSRNGPEAMAAARAAGANGFFQKPIDTNEFVRQLDELMREKGNR